MQIKTRVARTVTTTYESCMAGMRKFLGRHPKDVPVARMVQAVRTSYAPTEASLTSLAYRNRIKNRGTAIRAFCVSCVGGVANVRNCDHVTCPLWVFRTGKDPLRNK